MRKRYGQNFLINPSARKKLLDALDLPPGEAVWEIGPGLGAMTAGLLERGGRVRAFEVDRGFAEALSLIFRGERNFVLVYGDVLKTWRGEEGAAYLAGNLPYNIAALLLADFIEGGRFFKRMVVTVQKETAGRMLAKPGSRDYSSFSVLCASAYTISPVITLKGASFYPEPRVESQGLRLDLRTDVDPAAYPPLFRVLVRGLFAARRKTVKNNLGAFLGRMFPRERAGEQAEEILASCGIAPRKRAEDLALDDFTALTRALEPAFPGAAASSPERKDRSW
jgi:16S rRNA (adenine1518-N6/adenine1519-N6)-dimethyltransferase